MRLVSENLFASKFISYKRIHVGIVASPAVYGRSGESVAMTRLKKCEGQMSPDSLVMSSFSVSKTAKKKQTNIH